MDSSHDRKDFNYKAVMALAALGVVFGDIGTSPLYAFKECFSSPHSHLPPSTENILGVISLIIWTLMLIVSVKYVVFVMRADNRGEGGIMALVSLMAADKNRRPRLRTVLVLCGIFGAALLYGDGMITPAISVLSAVEGLREVDSLRESVGPFIIPITVVILIGLFACQRFGTGGVAKVFGPITLVWFLVLAALGIYGVATHDRDVLYALSPHHGVRFLFSHGLDALPVMGSVFLAVTGAEALYADMGHFGLKPIRTGWWFVVMPSLIFNYMGQGALLLEKTHAFESSPKDALAKAALEAAKENPFFHLAPEWASIPLVILATMATVIASQALITGAYSITMQAIQLGYLPRIRIQHTSEDERGQIYIPTVNGFLMVACITLVVVFRTSGALAAAYGVAVTLTMLTTTFLFYFVARQLWNWSAARALAVCAPLVVLEGVFAYANFLKFLDGGWVPALVGIVIFTLMTTWKRGRTLLREKVSAGLLPLREFVGDIRKSSVTRVGGTAVFMAGNPTVTPLALLHNLKHNKILHKRVIFLSIVTETVSHVEKSARATIEDLGEGCWCVIGHYGYMEEANVAEVLAITKTAGFECAVNQCTFFLSRETIVSARKSSLPLWRSKIFALMSKNAQSATAFFRLPPNRVVELGMQIEF